MSTYRFSLGDRRGMCTAIMALVFGVFLGKVLDVPSRMYASNRFSLHEDVVQKIAQKEQLPHRLQGQFFDAVQYISSRYGIATVESVLLWEEGAPAPSGPIFKGPIYSPVANMLAVAWSEEGFPRGSIAHNVSSVIFTRFIHREGDVVTRGRADYGNVIRILTPDFSSMGRMERFVVISRMDEAFAHELGHQNDWQRDSSLSPSQRIAFLYDVLKEMNRVRSYRDFYTEKFRGTPLHPVEWWATVCEKYLSSPHWFIHQYPRESELVEKWLPVPEDFNAQARWRWRLVLFSSPLRD